MDRRIKPGQSNDPKGSAARSAQGTIRATLSNANPSRGASQPFVPVIRPYQTPVSHPLTSSFVPAEGSAGAKVPIPRTTAADAVQHRRQRAPRACESCRQRKVKCDASQPICKQCQDLCLFCFYSDSKRARDKKERESLSKKVERYERLLRGLSDEVDDSISRRIKKALKDKPRGESSSLEEPEGEDPEDSSGSASSLGSLNAVDIAEEDVNRNKRTRATGFMGKNSEVTWMRRLEEEADKHENSRAKMTESPQEGPMSRRGRGSPALNEESLVTTMSYHLDDLNISGPDHVDPYACPPKELADKLFEAYLEHIHPSFPIIRRTTFTTQYRNFFTDRSSRPGNRWLAILNMIFAIGSKYFQFIRIPLEDDQIYLQRARLLSLSGNVLIHHPDLQQVQVETLTALYLLVSGQINRAWNISSMAARSAIALGTNLRNADENTTYESKEARCHVWWSIYILEHLLVVITGRASCIGNSVSSVDPPIPFEENSYQNPDVAQLFQDISFRDYHGRATLFESRAQTQTSTLWLKGIEPSPSLYFFYLVDLTIIAHAIINTVYTVDAVRDGWSRTVVRISKYDSKLETWLSKIPDSYKFLSEREGYDWQKTAFIRERFSLALHYYSARITLTRPCLTHPDTRASSQSAEQNSAQSRLGTDMAQICLDSAVSLLSLLPEDPDVAWLFRLSPWWCILHHIMQATIVVLLHLSLCPVKDLPEIKPVLATAKKAHCWLHQMASVSLTYQRAFRLCDGFLRRIAPGTGLDISELPYLSSVPPTPSAYHAREHRSQAEDSVPQRSYHHHSQDSRILSTEDFFRAEWVPDISSEHSEFRMAGATALGFLSSDWGVPPSSVLPTQPHSELAEGGWTLNQYLEQSLMEIDPIGNGLFPYGSVAERPEQSLFPSSGADNHELSIRQRSEAPDRSPVDEIS